MNLFSEKAQHLWRWISLRMLTQGRLVPRQPWAIKRTTRTELHRRNIRNYGFIHGNAHIISTALHGCNIHYGGYIHWNTGIAAYYPLNETMFSRKKLNTYGVESPCECLPRVDSFLANPGLSKEQHLRRCIVATFAIMDSFMETLA